MFPSKTIVERIREIYPAGTRVELVKMEDPQAPPVGTRGTVQYVDDIASLGVAWDNGSSLQCVYGEDKVKKLDSVTVICGGQLEVWDSRDEAEKFYLEGINSCDGSERCRYAKIYADLILGCQICTDEEDE